MSLSPQFPNPFLSLISTCNQEITLLIILAHTKLRKYNQYYDHLYKRGMHQRQIKTN